MELRLSRDLYGNVESKAARLKKKLLSQGRCPQCTMKVPCRHFNNSQIIPDVQIPSITPLDSSFNASFASDLGEPPQVISVTCKKKLPEAPANTRKIVICRKNWTKILQEVQNSSSPPAKSGCESMPHRRSRLSKSIEDQRLNIRRKMIVFNQLRLAEQTILHKGLTGERLVF